MTLILAAALGWPLLLALPGCGGAPPTREQTIQEHSQELRKAVSARVPDGQRKVQLLQIVDSVEALQLRFTRETAEFMQAFRKLNEDYEATRPAFERLFSDYSARRVTARDEALDLHFKLAALTTAEEWEAIAKAEADLYEDINVTEPAAERTT